MQRLLVLYASREGQTEKIARRIVDEAEHLGIVCELGDLGRKASWNPATWDGVIAGAPLHRGRYPAEMLRFALTHAPILNTMRSAFFSVSLAAASKQAAERREAGRLAQAFLDRAGWHPALIASFAGALRYSRYSLVTRWIMKRIARAEGGDTDTSRDYEYTDWAQVTAFVHAFCGNGSARHEA